MASINPAHDHLQRQREYVKNHHLEGQRAVASRGTSTALVDERVLAESMRSVRYANEAHAAGDIIDNSIEAGASQQHIVMHTDRDDITEIAFIDDGSGIDENFLPHAVKWGGSSNDGQRNVFGRFGFGLPSASVNRGRAFSVYSRTEANAPFAKVSIDLDNLKVDGTVLQVPDVSREDLPTWVQDYLAGDKFIGGAKEVRSVVIWSSFDRLVWPKRQQSAARLREHLGITYSGWLDICKMFVNGEAVEPVDVLFTTPGFRYYDIPGAPRAESHSPIRFAVKDGNGVDREITVRFSLLMRDAYKVAISTGGKGNKTVIRQKIRTEYNGFFVTRNGRFIELAKPSYIVWNNYARQVGIAIDFPPELDELFGVTPDKQTIIFSERLLRLLDDNGVKAAFLSLEREVTHERKKADAENDAKQGNAEERPSEIAIAKTVERNFRRTRKASQETQDEAERNFRDRVKELAKGTGLPEEQVAKAQEEVLREKPYRVEFVTLAEDDPFYTPMMVHTQLILRINMAHAWYRELYGRLRPDQAEIRSGLELMLWVLAKSEMDAPSADRLFYQDERREWSRLLGSAFTHHPGIFHGAASSEELIDDDPQQWADDDFEEAS